MAGKKSQYGNAGDPARRLIGRILRTRPLIDTASMGNMISGPMPALELAVALGAGLLMGLERERRKRALKQPGFAGVRTFGLTALAGALAQALPSPWLVIAGALLLGALIAIAYFRSSASDPGLTTEIALFVAYLIGVSAITAPALAAGAAVAATIVLAARTGLHSFSTEILTEDELRDGLILGAAAMIVLPIVPDTPIAWLAGVNPRTIWTVVVLLLAIQGVGHIGLRALGPRYGLAISGFLSGFVSSTGTIAAMGLRAKREPAVRSACVAAALLSCLATFLQLLILAAALKVSAVRLLAPLAASALAATLLLSAPWIRRASVANGAQASVGRAFSLPKTLGFAALLAALTAISAWMSAALGNTAVWLTSAVAGFADIHAAAAAALSLAGSGAVQDDALPLLILIAASTNTVSKIVASFAGGSTFALRVAPSLIIIALAAWLPWLWVAMR